MRDPDGRNEAELVYDGMETARVCTMLLVSLVDVISVLPDVVPLGVCRA